MCSFYRINVFLTKYGHDSKGFFMKNPDTMTWEYRVFERMDVFLRKYGNESIVFYFLREWMFFWQSMGMWAVIFTKKFGKRAPSTFWQIIYCSFDRIYVFLTKNRHDSRGFFMKIWIIWYESTVFLRELTFFWQNMGMGSVFSFENVRFLSKMRMRAVMFL